MDVTGPAVFEIGIVLLLAAGAGWAARHVGIPSVVGYLAVGLLISPFTPGYVADRAELHVLADVGVVLLLFEVGIELDLLRLRREQGALAWVAPAQTLITTLAGTAVAVALGIPLIGAGIVGVAIALSSGVVVVNITRSRRRTTDRPTEEALLGWSALQDVTGVAVAAVLVGLLGVGERPVLAVLVGLVLFGAIAILSAVVLPIVLRSLRAEHDVFLIVSVGSGLALAGLGAVFFGVPLALAAFVAGLAISEGPDTAEARRRLRPFRDVFAVLFFVAIGTLVDPRALLSGLTWLGVILAVVLVGKTLVTYLLARLGRLAARPWQLAIGLSQVGEFSFVLASAALAAGAIGQDLYAGMLGAIIVSIAISTVAVRFGGARVPAHTGAPSATPEAA